MNDRRNRGIPGARIRVNPDPTNPDPTWIETETDASGYALIPTLEDPVSTVRLYVELPEGEWNGIVRTDIDPLGPVIEVRSNESAGGIVTPLEGAAGIGGVALFVLGLATHSPVLQGLGMNFVVAGGYSAVARQLEG